MNEPHKKAEFLAVSEACKDMSDLPQAKKNCIP